MLSVGNSTSTLFVLYVCQNYKIFKVIRVYCGIKKHAKVSKMKTKVNLSITEIKE